MRRLLSANTLFLCLLDTVIAAQEELYTQRGAAKFYFRATRMIISRSQVGSDIPGILHTRWISSVETTQVKLHSRFMVAFLTTPSAGN
jgi:hypothetical protein